MKLYIQTLSPVHIGSGKEIEPFEYVVKQGRYFRINIDSAMRKLYESGKWEEYETWLNDIEKRLEKTTNNREQSRIRKDINVIEFCSRKLKHPQLADELLNNHSLYQAKCLSMVDFRVREVLKSPNGDIYIPGSSIKGAIRTALIYAALSENPELWKQSYRKISDRVKSPKKAGQGLETLIMCCGEKKKEYEGKFATRFGDAKFDLMKIIRISDTFIHSASLEVKKSAVFSTDRKTGQVKKVMDLPVEVVAPESVFQIELEVDSNFLLNAKKYESDRGWIGLKDKMQRVFRVDVTKVNSHNVYEACNAILERLKQTCINFSEDNIKNDNAWIQKIPREKSYSLKKFQDSLVGNKWIIKLGWGTGWTGTTIGLFLKAKNLQQDFNELNRKFRIARGRTNLYNFPLSRRLVYENDIPTMSLGWLRLSTEPMESKVEKAEIKTQE